MNTSLNENGSCIVCGKKTECKCDRCGDFYCSEECQRKDWAGHRFICFPMPKLVKVRQSTIVKNDIPNNIDQPQHAAKNENSSKKENQLPNGSCVFLTCFKSSNRCFVRSTNPSAIAEQEKVLNEVNNFGKKSSALSEKPKSNSFALARRGEKWCRVQILGPRDNVYRVHFTDFGERSTKSFKELRKTVPAIVNLPCHLHMLTLKGITNFSTQHKLLKSLNQYENKEYKIQYATPNKAEGNVELFQWGTTISLNSLINELSSKHNDNNDIDHHSVASSSSNVEVVKTGLSEKNENEKYQQQRSDKSINGITEKRREDSKTSDKETRLPINIGNGLVNSNTEIKKASSLPRQIQMQKACLIPPFEIIPLNKNDHDSNILIMDNSNIESGFIGCLLEKYCENLKAVTKFLNEYDVGDQSYKPKFAEYCLAQFDNMWYRAKVVEILSEDKFLVVYIDFTNEKELSSDCIRRYPLSLDLACCTTMCGIDGLPDELSDGLKTFLEEKLTSFSVLHIDSIRVEENICYMKSNELLNKLRSLKLI